MVLADEANVIHCTIALLAVPENRPATVHNLTNVLELKSINAHVYSELSFLELI
jgi:hypothetical protein